MRIEKREEKAYDRQGDMMKRQKNGKNASASLNTGACRVLQAQGTVSAGFPSPAEDYTEGPLDLNAYLIRHPAATFFVRVQGDSMIKAGIHSGDLLIVDRSLEASHNNIILAVLNGEFTVKRLIKSKGRLFLAPENPEYSSLEITEESHFEAWGVVTAVIHEVL